MKRFFFLVAALGLTALVPACANRSGDQTVAAYCADPSRAREDVCEVQASVDETRVTLGERIAQTLGIANDARSRADRAQSTADTALATTNATELTCVTRTLRNQQTGTCDPGYTLTACSQTRFTTSAGGLSILREVNDERCRFNTRVLEMQVRCCYAGPTPPPSSAPISAPVPQPTQQAPQASRPPRTS